VDEYHRLIEFGLLQEGAPIELIEGILVYKDRGEGGRPMTYGPRNATCVRRLAALDSRFSGHGYHLRTQLPITIEPDHEPEPDGALVRGNDGSYRERHPGPQDCRLVIEVAETSLERDRQIKQKVYATAGIPEYWIVNLRSNTVEVYEQPDAQSSEYRLRRDRQRGETIEMVLPGSGGAVQVEVDEILG
jgi:Uma2 family endonuclease